MPLLLHVGLFVWLFACSTSAGKAAIDARNAIDETPEPEGPGGTGGATEGSKGGEDHIRADANGLIPSQAGAEAGVDGPRTPTPAANAWTGIVPCSQTSRFWPFETDGAVSLTYDDALTSPVRYALPALDAKGWKATFFLTTGKSWNPAFWKPLVQSGHELASHTVTHDSTLPQAAMEKEVVASLASIAGLGAVQPHFSFAYPNGEPNGPDGSYEPAVLRHALAARGLNGGSQRLGTPVDYGNIPARILGATDDLESIIDETLKRHAWTVFVVHGIEDDLYLNIPRAKHDELVAVLARKKVWVAPFITVADYLKRCQL